jgi:uncharacterized protein YjiS (DUF1127 family)
MTTASMLNSLYHCGFCVQVSAFVDTWKTHRKNKEGARQLEAMNDHQLNDIGLTRGDISAVRRGLIRDHYRSMV